MSVELRKIYDGELWKLRNDEEGKPKYKSFAKFIAAEVDVHERTVWRMIEVTKEFKEEQAQKYGVSILRGLLAAPKEDRSEVLEKIDAGQVQGKRGVEAEVKKIRDRKKVTGAATTKTTKTASKAAKASAASAKKAAEKRGKTVTVPFPAGRKTIRLFTKSTSKDEAPKRAKQLGERPWGKLECSNGVSVFVALVKNDKGEMELTIEARREE